MISQVQRPIPKADEVLVPTLPSGTTLVPRDDPLSPELALVDPDLAVRARHRLAEPADPPRRTQPEVRSTASGGSDPAAVKPVAVSDATAVSAVAALPESTDVRNGSASDVFDDPDAAVRRLDALAAQTAEPPPQRLRRVLAAVAVTSAGLALAFLLAGGQLGPDQESLAVEGSASTELPQGGDVETGAVPPADVPEEPEPPATGDPPSTTPSSTPTSPTAQRFAWAPVPEASAYHVELFLGSARVFASDTTRPEIAIPASWMYDGERYRFEPAEYRWYVWPVVAGKRMTKAVVQARLVVGES